MLRSNLQNGLLGLEKPPINGEIDGTIFLSTEAMGEILSTTSDKLIHAALIFFAAFLSEGLLAQ